MIVNDANLNAIRIGVQTNMMKSYAGTESVWAEFMMLTTSQSAEEGYPFTDDLGLMQEYFGELSVEQIVAYLYKLKNRKFGRSYALKVEDIERDAHLRILPNQAEAWGRAMKLWGDTLLGEQFRAAFDGGPTGLNLAHDQVFFCDTSHPVPITGGGFGVDSNKITKALDFSTVAAAKASFGAAKDLFQGRTDKDGNPLMLRPNVLAVGTDLEDVATTGMTTDRLEDGKPNIYKNKCKVKVFDWIKTGEWFILDLSSPVKPFIFQQEKKPTISPVPSADSDQVRIKEIVDLSVKARGAGGYGHWQLVVGSTGTT